MKKTLAPWLCLPLVALALACDPETGPGPGDKNDPVYDEAWWGLADGRCLRFKDDGGKPYYTVEMKLKDEKGVRVFELKHSHLGWEQRTDSLVVEDDTLVLRRRKRLEGQAQPTLIFGPAPVYLRAELREGGSVVSETTGKGGGADVREQTFTTAWLGEEDVVVGGESVTATKYMLTVETTSPTPDTYVDFVWFAPERGIVQLQLGSEQDLGVQTLAETFHVTDEKTCTPDF